MEKIKKFCKYYLPPFIWAFIIFLLSSRAVPVTTEIYWQDFIFKKTAHILEYGFLTLLIYRALKNSKVSPKNAGIIALVAIVIYAASDEFHQSFVPGREARIRDVIFDTIGAGLVIYYIWNLLPKAPKKLKNLAKKLQVI